MNMLRRKYDLNIVARMKSGDGCTIPKKKARSIQDMSRKERSMYL